MEQLGDDPIRKCRRAMKRMKRLTVVVRDSNTELALDLNNGIDLFNCVHVVLGLL